MVKGEYIVRGIEGKEEGVNLGVGGDWQRSY